MGNARRRRGSPRTNRINKAKAVISDINHGKQAPNSNNSSSCILKLILVVVIVIGLVGVIAAYGFYKSPFTAVARTDFSQKVELVGKFEPNKKLSHGKRITNLDSPESFAEDNKGSIYTGLGDGRIVRIDPSGDGKIGEGKLTNVTDGVIENVATSIAGATHGRPLGLRLVGDTLYVVDAVYGLFSVDVKTGEVMVLVTPDAVDPPLMFVDDLSLTKDENFIYFSDGSAKYSIRQVPVYFFEGICDGRVLQYNIKTKQIRTVMSDLCFPNGVQLSDDEKVLLVSETFRHHVRIIDTMTWKTLQFVDVAIFSDNIRPSGKGTYLVAGSSPINSINIFLEKSPVVRQILAGLFDIEALSRKAINNHNIVVEMTQDGEVIQTFHDPDGELIQGLTQITALSDGRFALGSYFRPHMAILDEKALYP